MTMQSPPHPTQRCVIVTGGGRGLGWEMAEALVLAGHRVLITGSRERGELQEAADRLNGLTHGLTNVLTHGQTNDRVSGQTRDRGPTTHTANGHPEPPALACAADVTSWSDCEAVAALALKAWGRIDGLVNNAGRGMAEISDTFNRQPALFWKADPKAFSSIVDTNVTGAFQMARACVPTMVAQGFGRVLNISTSAQTMVRKGYCPYGPSKAALEAMSVIWARDLQGTGVSVNVLLPGGASDTRLIPGHGQGRTGADGLLLPPSLMRAPALWLLTEADETVSGQRFVARRWANDLPALQAADRARDPSQDLPAIM